MMNGINWQLGRERARGSGRRWGALAALVALAIALASLGGQSHGVQAEAPLTGEAEYGGTTWTAGARLAGATEPSAPSADVEEEDNQLGEAYRLKVPKTSGIRWVSATKANVGFYGHPSTVAVGDLACSVEGSNGTSFKMPDNPRTGFGVTLQDLTPNTAYQFWIQCKDATADGSGAVRVGPTTEITTLKQDALKPQKVTTDAGWHSITVQWKWTKSVFRCHPMLNNEEIWAVLRDKKNREREGEYRYEGLTPGTSYTVQLRCGLPHFYDYQMSDPITVTTRELESIAGFEAPRKDSDWIRIRWEKLDQAKRYMVSFMPGAKKGTACGTGEGTGAWQVTQQKTKHLQTGLQPDTRYKVCLKATGPGDDTMSHTESLFVRTKPSAD